MGWFQSERRRAYGAKFAKPEEMAEAVEEYIQSCIDEKEYPTTAGMAVALGFATRKSLYDYRKNGQFKDVVDRALLFVESGYEHRLVNNDAGAGGTIFALKNVGHSRWTDKQDVNHTSADGSMTPKDQSLAVLDALRKKHEI